MCAGEDAPHGGHRNGNAAFGRGEPWRGNVQEDGAAGAAPRAGKIVVEHDDDVVKTVGSPEALVAGPEGQADLAVVEPVGRIVAPAGIGAERNGRQASCRTADAVGPVEDGDQGKPPGRRRAVAFALPPEDAVPPEGAG